MRHTDQIIESNAAETDLGGKQRTKAGGAGHLFERAT